MACRLTVRSSRFSLCVRRSSFYSVSHDQLKSKYFQYARCGPEHPLHAPPLPHQVHQRIAQHDLSQPMELLFFYFWHQRQRSVRRGEAVRARHWTSIECAVCGDAVSIHAYSPNSYRFSLYCHFAARVSVQYMMCDGVVDSYCRCYFCLCAAQIVIGYNVDLWLYLYGLA